MIDEDIDKLLQQVKERLISVGPTSKVGKTIQAHLRSLARWNSEPMDYLSPTDIAFPEELPVAFAVCHPECGCGEFIVDGSTQECQHCGSLMFRYEKRWYIKKEI